MKYSCVLIAIAAFFPSSLWCNAAFAGFTVPRHGRAPCFGLSPLGSHRQLPSSSNLRHFSVAGDSENTEAGSGTYFQMEQMPVATSGTELEHVRFCAENGGCDIEEMMNMIDELEKLNAECEQEGETGLECSLDDVAARNVLKVALASKVAMEDAISDIECEIKESDDPYASMMDMEDECQPDYMLHTVPSATTPTTTTKQGANSMRLDRIIECTEANDGTCDVEEMLQMVEELEKLNMECEGALSRECSLDAVAARNILKVALASKVTTEQHRE